MNNLNTAISALPPQASCAKSLHIQSTLDPFGMMLPMLSAQYAWLTHPLELTQKVRSLFDHVVALQWHSWQRALGLPSNDLVKPHIDDTRFADPIWSRSPTWDIYKQWYLLFTRETEDMLYQTPGLPEKDCHRAAFWWREYLNMMAPTNFLATNPVAQRLAFESKGMSLIKGAQIFLEDMKFGNVQMSRIEHFTVGKHLGATPGKVVLRNRLVEIIHYTPTAEKVYETPIVIATPWINKHYILDLTPKKSMVKYLLDQGFEVFLTSWKNPTKDMADITFDDYLMLGIGEMIEVARNITGAKQVHAVGYCLGGAALSTYMAWANRHYAPQDMPVCDFTLFASMLDCQNPGDIEVFIDEPILKLLEKKMDKDGFLDGKDLATSFRLMRANGLIWHYVEHGYLYGEKPAPFDVLYWNMDTTRLPAAMHKWYLRELYINNNLIKKDALTVAGEKIDLGRIVQPMYLVSTVDDHITPWRSNFQTCNYIGGKSRFVLSSSGHILGIVNPAVASSRREYSVESTEQNDTTENWEQRATKHAGSWWVDWMAWLKPQSGKLVSPGPVTTEQYPALADAPGTYVMER